MNWKAVGKRKMGEVKISKFRFTQVIVMSLSCGATVGFVIGYIIGLLDKLL